MYIEITKIDSHGNESRISIRSDQITGYSDVRSDHSLADVNTIVFVDLAAGYASFRISETYEQIKALLSKD